MEAANPDLWLRIRGAARRTGLSGFWSWWMGQLAPLIPARMHNVVQRRRLRPVLAFGTDAVVLWVPAVANSHLAYKEVARIALSADEAAVTIAGRAAIEGLSPAVKGRGAGPVRIVARAGRRPCSAQDDHAAGGDRGQSRAGADVRSRPAHAVQARRSQFRRDRRRTRSGQEGNPRGLGGGAQDHRGSGAAAGGELGRDRRRGHSRAADRRRAARRSRAESFAGCRAARTSSRRRWELWGPLALIAAAVLVATALPLWQKRGYAIALLQQAAQARAQADASGTLRDELERLTGDYNFALQKKYAFPTALQSIEDVTELLPDDTWLTRFEMKNHGKGEAPHREILVRGESANAGRLISLLEESKLFELAAPRSPTTRSRPAPAKSSTWARSSNRCRRRCPWSSRPRAGVRRCLPRRPAGRFPRRPRPRSRCPPNLRHPRPPNPRHPAPQQRQRPRQRTTSQLRPRRPLPAKGAP